jgi:hypothetical protein
MTAAVDDGVYVCESLSLALNVREVMYYAHVHQAAARVCTKEWLVVSPVSTANNKFSLRTGLQHS